MGCGKSKHDVVTGNTKTVRKPSEAESVKGKEKETMKRQESCRCGKTNDISAGDRSETTVENNNKKPEEKEAGGNGNPKAAGETNDDEKIPEEKDKTTSPPIVSVNNAMPVDEQNEKIDIDETVVDDEIPPPEVEEPKSDVKAELGIQETPTTENEIPPPEVEEPKSDVQTPTTENDEIPENDETPVLKDEDKVDVVEVNLAHITEEVESAA